MALSLHFCIIQRVICSCYAALKSERCSDSCCAFILTICSQLLQKINDEFFVFSIFYEAGYNFCLAINEK